MKKEKQENITICMNKKIKKDTKLHNNNTIQRIFKLIVNKNENIYDIDWKLYNIYKK